MCGITGIYNFKAGINKDMLLKMTDALKHRGPDDSGIFIKENIGLGHRRLSVIDLSPLGHQPMANEDQTLWIVFNGEIYNFQELKDILEKSGHKFKSKTDTEVILHAYEEWGKECVKGLNGMFAFAIFNEKENSIFLARDRLGEKPLYYYIDENKFIFASEIKAILEDPKIKREIDNQGFANYFAFGHSIAPNTIYKGVKKLLPGHFLNFKNGKIFIGKYWNPTFENSGKDESENFYTRRTRELFEESVKSRLVSDVPLGVFLSGGLDSCSVAAVVAKNSSLPVKTFSVGFNIKGSEFNELSDSRLVANYFKTDHYELILQEYDLLQAIDKLVYHYDEPFGDAAAMPVFYLSKFARNHVTVVLTGEGGDEIFGGYRRYIIEKNRKDLMFLLPFLNGFTAEVAGSFPGLRRFKKIANSFSIKDDTRRYASWVSFFSKDMLLKLFLQSPADIFQKYGEYFSECASKDPLSKAMYLDQKIILPDAYLEKVDKASMAFGLETRAPILDPDLVEFANKMPSRYKIRGLKTKYIFRKAVKDLLPAQILNKKKHGFAVPTNPWFKGKLKDYLFDVVFDRKTMERGYFNYEYIKYLYKLYQQKNQPLDPQFWLLLCFELWHRKFIDKI